jgi:hypothetical protein
LRWATAELERTGSARWKIDAGPTIAYLDRLLVSGWTLADIAARADVGLGTLKGLRWRRHRRPRCWNTIAGAVRALEPR